jgi:acyl carrier protein
MGLMYPELGTSRRILNMDKTDILRDVATICGTGDTILTEDTVLADLPGWDSMAQMELLSFMDGKLGVNVEFGALGRLSTVRDILRLVESNH